MGQRRALIDSNVLVAFAARDHLHHSASRTYLGASDRRGFAVASHSLSEFYNTSTRRTTPGAAVAAPTIIAAILRAFADDLEILSLTIAQHLDALQRFAALGGAGPRVYDYLIGQVAVVHAIPLLVTWNVRHFQPLFPTVRVATPETLLQEP